jgi:ethylbenzene dioxygenase subunit beta
MADAAEMAVTREAAERLLFLEARLLDERRYDEWNELFAEDGIYWLPIVDEYGREPDEGEGVSILYDDPFRRGERIFRTLHTPVLDQNPPSRTIHAVSNVEVEPEPGSGGGAIVRCVQLIAEMRPGGAGQVGLGTTCIFPARCEYLLRAIGGELRIAKKKVVLLESDRSLYNLSFVV